MAAREEEEEQSRAAAVDEQTPEPFKEVGPLAASLTEEVATTPEEVGTMAAGLTEDVLRQQAQGARITVALIPTVQDDLRRLQERTNLSMTDLANRAITSYEFFDAQLQAGHDVIVRNNSTGEARLVRFQ
jgi:hypothetical protein